jgi:hypothetical protein
MDGWMDGWIGCPATQYPRLEIILYQKILTKTWVRSATVFEENENKILFSINFSLHYYYYYYYYYY